MYTFEVKINKIEIMNEVRNETHKVGKAHDNGQLTPQQVSNLQADDLAQDTHIVMISVDNSIERAVAQLSKHIENVDSTTDRNQVVVTFKMSRYYSPVNDASIKSGLTDFVKKHAIYDFLKLSEPTQANAYKKEAEAILIHVKQTLNFKKWRNQ